MELCNRCARLVSVYDRAYVYSPKLGDEKSLELLARVQRSGCNVLASCQPELLVRGRNNQRITQRWSANWTIEDDMNKLNLGC